jgi:ribosomal protein S18 acetylase RimI-like enzyme
MIREIDPDSREEIELVAKRMRLTLIDVLGDEKGTALYTMQWLIDRVRWHLAPERRAKIYLAETQDGIAGQAIARIENDDSGNPYGYFSTIYIEPQSRRQGIARILMDQVEEWFIEQKVPKVTYNTAVHHVRLKKIFELRGYKVTLEESEMVQLTKHLDQSSFINK